MDNYDKIKTSVRQYFKLNHEQRQVFLQDHPEVANDRVAEYALSQARTLGNENLRLLTPDPTDVEDFKTYALGAYGIAAHLHSHAICAEAAGLLANVGGRFGEKSERELWFLTQAIHSTLTYPQPKFSSTFDIIVSTTVNVAHMAEGDYAPVVGFFQQVCDLISEYVGSLSIDELLKFITIPHDPHSVVVSLLYLADLHMLGLDASKALLAIRELARAPRGSALISAAVNYAVYVIEVYPHNHLNRTPERDALFELVATMGVQDEIRDKTDFMRFVGRVKIALLWLWPVQ